MMAENTTRLLWDRIFWGVLVIDGIGALTMILASEGSQDAAGRGMQSGFGIMLLTAVATLASIYWFFKTPFLRIPVFLVAALPGLVLAFMLLWQ
jgi:hypothetical protein